MYVGAETLSQTRIQVEKGITVVVKQLPSEKGIVPIEVSCDKAQVQAGKLERLSCVLKNNASRPVVAAGLRVTISLDREGKKSQDSGLLTVDSQWLSPLREDANNLIPPGGQYYLEDLPSDYDDATIQGIEVHLDYVEFADSDSLGPDSGTSKKVREARTGVAKYREWLGREIEKAGGKIEAILPLLETYQGLPPELEGGDQQEGAKKYRSYIRRLYLTKGPESVRKQVKTLPPTTGGSK